MKDDRLLRIDQNSNRIDNTFGVDAVLFVNDQVPVESATINELLSMLGLQSTLERC